ncbi:MAG: ABC transporter permease [Acetobacteraceae bacterium]|nr:MAG: ABC transporter permease [Acetobacteraceae bacterium]
MSLAPPSRFDARRAATIAALLAPGLALLGLVLVWPFLVMMGLSVRERFPGPFVFTLAKYVEFLGDEYLLNIALRTFTLALTVTAISAVVAYPVAWFLARSRSRWKHLVFLGTIFPLLVSIVVRTMGWTILLGSEGLVNAVLLRLGLVDEPLRLMQGFWSVVLGMVHVLLPFMVLSIATVLGRIDAGYGEAAATLGATPLRSFLTVTLPLSVQGIAAGSVIVFCLTIGAFITPLWLGRGHVTIMAIAIHEQMVTLVDWPGGAASAMLLTFSTLVLLAGYGLLLRRWARR